MGELYYNIDNRDSTTTWLQIYDNDNKHLGYIELTLDGICELLRNMIENAEGGSNEN